LVCLSLPFLIYNLRKFAEEKDYDLNSILFFGGFQIINRDGIDITSKFTPLLKELFLLIFLNSIKDKGISILKRPSQRSRRLWN